ncbi:MAG: filamentous hemagglutinin N-terminal domain-containing protein [Candidatus Caenarcaniphilales bacterium]|nr:filamentous hemagglutinin N-terminal domain-containing protein [Candidatus Caenarcaniphilales bacterium]
MPNSNFIKSVYTEQNGAFKIGECFGKREFLSCVVGSGLLLLLLSSPAYALDPNTIPSGIYDTTGISSISTNGSALNVNASADKSIANWQTFSIGSNRQVNFNLPGSGSVVLNRVTGGLTSEIDGSIYSNGSVFLINPSGILFGQNSQVNVNSLVASTLSISDKDFLNGNYVFQRSGAPAGVVNEGTINVAGNVVLLGSAVQNSGLINASEGNVALAVGQQVTVALGDGVSMSVTVDKPLQEKVEAFKDAVSNTGSIKADGGSVSLKTKLQNAIYDRAVNNEGLIQANSLISHNGSIELVGESVNGKAVVANSGHLEATSENGKGGSVKVLGDEVLLSEGALVNVSGATGGGEILVGGSAHGADTTVKNASNTIVDKDVVLKADAVKNGDGGQVVVWADKNTFFDGSISAKGGRESGNGGFIETSGKENLGVGSNAKVNALAPNGKAGDWLLDPRNITIQAGGPDTPTLAQLADNTDVTSDFVIDPSIINNAAANVSLLASQDINFNSSINMANAGVGLQAIAGGSINALPGVTLDFYNANLDLLALNNINMPGTIIRSRGGDVGITSANGNLNLGQINTSQVNAVGPSLGGGDINLLSTSGSITTAALNSVSESFVSNAGNGGDVNLLAAGPIQVTGGGIRAYSYSQNNGTTSDGGAITIISTDDSIAIDGYVNTASIAQQNGGDSGNGGDITLLARNNITHTGPGIIYLDASSESTAGNSGNGGNIFVGTANGDINLRSLATVSLAAQGSGDSGQIIVDAGNNFNAIGLQSNNVSVNGTAGLGGDIAINSLNGATTIGFVTTSSESRSGDASNAGSIDIQAQDAVQITNGSVGIRAFSFSHNNGTSADGGDISITSTNDSIAINGYVSTASLAQLNSGDSGNGGDITLTAQNNINHTGPSLIFLDSSSESSAANSGNGGNITLTTTAGDINARYVASVSFADQNSGDAGQIQINAGNNFNSLGVQSSTFATNGTAGLGGPIDITANNNVGIVDVISYSTANNGVTDGGDINVTAGNTVQLSTINNPAYSSGSNFAYGDITLTGNEVNLVGGANTVNGINRNITIQQFTPSQDIAIGGPADTGAGVLDLTANDIATLADGFTTITIGRPNGTGQATVVAPTIFKDPTTIQNGSVNILANLTAPDLDINALTGNVNLGAVNVTASGNLTADAAASILATGGLPRLEATFLGLTAAKVADPAAPIGLKATDPTSFVNDGSAQYIPGQNITTLNDWTNGGGNPFRRLEVTADGFYLYPLFTIQPPVNPIVSFEADNSLFFPNKRGDKTPVVSLSKGSLQGTTSESSALFISTSGTYIIPPGVPKTDKAVASLFDGNGNFILATGKSTDKGQFIQASGVATPNQLTIGNLAPPPQEIYTIYSGTLLPINNVGSNISTSGLTTNTININTELDREVSLKKYIELK